MSLGAEIRARAAGLGFEKAGIARLGDLPRADYLREWLAREYQGSMDYMSREPGRRADPREGFPWAKSVVCVAKNYRTLERPADEPGRGVISRYAWGGDYHEFLMGRLGVLRSWLEERGLRAKVCVDTSAVLEKLWARQAGLGWQGKHSNLIAKDLSSWFFLGEILVDAELEPDAPFRNDHCGTCTRCIDLCPTRAIVAPYVVDSRKCIAYLTIEHRGPIPRNLRPLMGNLIFGCDICQDVCPWNKFAKVSPEAEFLPREGMLAPKLVEFLGLTREEFARRFKGSPIKRAKRAGFLRNVCVALGNSGDRSSIPALARALSDDEPLVRLHAAWALGRMGAVDVLRGHRDADPDVQAEVELSLAEITSAR